MDSVPRVPVLYPWNTSRTGGTVPRDADSGSSPRFRLPLFCTCKWQLLGHQSPILNLSIRAPEVRTFKMSFSIRVVTNGKVVERCWDLAGGVQLRPSTMEQHLDPYTRSPNFDRGPLENSRSKDIWVSGICAGQLKNSIWRHGSSASASSGPAKSVQVIHLRTPDLMSHLYEVTAVSDIL